MLLTYLDQCESKGAMLPFDVVFNENGLHGAERDECMRFIKNKITPCEARTHDCRIKGAEL